MTSSTRHLAKILLCALHITDSLLDSWLFHVLCFSYSLSFAELQLLDSHWSRGRFVHRKSLFSALDNNTLYFQAYLSTRTHQQRSYNLALDGNGTPRLNSGHFALYDFHDVYEERLLLAGCFLAALSELPSQR